MTLLRTSALSAISTLIRIGAGLIINKVVAVYVGPSGLALVGQFQSFANLVQALANGGITTGVVKYVAEYRSDDARRSQLLGTALSVSVACGLIVSVLLVFNRKFLSVTILKTDEFSSLFASFGLALLFFVLNSMMLSVLNGWKEIGRYTAVNIFSSIISLALTLFLVSRYQLRGALFSIVILHPLVLLVTLLLFIRCSDFSLRDLRPRLHLATLSNLGGFALMAATSAFSGPLSQMLVRNYLIEAISADAAGYWEGVWRISGGYLSLFTVPIAVYYLPRIAEIRDDRVLRTEILHGYRLILPAVVCMAAAIYVFRDTIIRILYTDAFSAASGLFAFQLVGDCLKIASWLLSYVLVGRAMLKPYIATEILFSAGFVLLSIFFVDYSGLRGVTYAYALNYGLYLVTMCWLLRNVLAGNPATDDQHGA